MPYGSRYVRVMAGDPGFLSGLKKIASKALAPVAKIAGVISKVPIVGTLARAIPGVGTAISLATLAGPAVKAAQGGIAAARAAIGGSKITTGALKLGGQTLLPSRPGVGTMVGAGTATAVALGIGGAVRSAARKKPKKASSASRSGGSRRRTTTSAGRCGCKAGTRKVCFKSGKRSGGTKTAAQKRFAAAARKYGGRIPKGASL